MAQNPHITFNSNKAHKAHKAIADMHFYENSLCIASFETISVHFVDHFAFVNYNKNVQNGIIIKDAS